MAATDVERLAIALEARTATFERQLARAERKMSDEARKIEDRVKGLNRNVQRELDNVRFDALAASARAAGTALNPLITALATGFSAANIIQQIDAYTRSLNALKVAGLEGPALTQTFKELFEVAQRQGTPIESVTRLYGQLSQAQADLKVTSEQLITVVDATGAALRISGAAPAQAAGAMLGLSQALSGGTVRAEEFNQMLEGGLRPALQIVADNILQAGGSVGKLRQLVNDGEVSSRAFFEALRRGAPQLDELASKAGGTSAQAMARLQNELQRFAGEADKALNISGTLAAAINNVANAAGAGAESIGRVVERLRQATKAADDYITRGPQLLRFLYLAAQFNPANMALLPQGGAQPGAPASGFDRGRFDMVGSGYGISPEQGSRLKALLTDTPPKLDLNDPAFRPEGKGGGGGGGGSAAQRISDYEREVEALNKRRQAIEFDIETFGRSAEAISRARVEQTLLTALQKDGVAVTDEQRARVAELAQAYSDTEARLKTMKDAQAAANELTRFAGQNLSSFFSDVVSGGKNASEALMNLTKRLADAALQALLLGEGPLAKIFGTASSGGGVGGLFGAIGGALFGGERANGGPISPGRAYLVGERGPEIVVPSRGGYVVPNHALGGGGGTVRVMIESDGRLPAMIRAEAQGVAVQVSQAAVAQNNRTLPAMLAERELR